MISIYVNENDLLETRFAVSPLGELTLSAKVLQNPSCQPPFRAWLAEAERALYGHEFPYIAAVVAPTKYIADFVTPTPTSMQTSLEDEFDLVRNTPPELVRRNMQVMIDLHGETEARRHFMTDPSEAITRLLEEMRYYWKLTLAHHWRRIHTTLEKDVLFRARQMAFDGHDTMLSELNYRLRYEPGKITVLKEKAFFCGDTYHLDGRGMVLIPSMFKVRGVSWMIEDEWAPMIAYKSRGGGLWYYEPSETDDSLQLTVGAGKARVLEVLLSAEASTSELAEILDVTAGAVSQQVAKLTEAGLIESHRQGNRVYHHLSRRGERLLEVFAEEL